MRQKDRSLVHIINLTGHSDTAYFGPVPMKDLQIKIRGSSTSARAIRSSQSIPVSKEAGYSQFTLPSLDEYELIELRD